MEIYLIRHTRVNCEERVCYGHTDLDVADTFDDELKNVRQRLDWKKNDEILAFSSPLVRCKLLAENLVDNTLNFDKRLMELNFGEWELQKWDSISSDHYVKWCCEYIETPCPQGESFQDLYKRTTSFFDEIASKNNDKIAIITHAGVIRAMLAYVMELPLHRAFSLRIDYGSISKIKLDGQIRNIEYINR